MSNQEKKRNKLSNAIDWGRARTNLLHGKIMKER